MTRKKKKKNAQQRWVKKRKGKKQAQKSSAEDASEEQGEEKQQSSAGQARKCPSQSRVPEKGRRREVGVSGEHPAEGMGLGFWCLRS